MRHRLQLAMVVLSLTVFVGACGGGDDGDPPPTTAAAPATTVASTGLQRLPEVFARVSGYSYRQVSDADLGDIEEEFTSNPLAKAAVVGVDGRTVSQGGDEVGAVIAIRFDEAASSLSGFADGFLAGVTTDAVSSEEVTIAGETAVLSTDADDTVYISWIKDDLAIVVVGQDEATVRPLATGLIEANR